MPALLTATLREQLLANGRRTARGEEIDPRPVVKLFMPDGPGTWLLAELDPAEPTRAFGLCDPGLGSPELGYVDLTELAALRGRLRLSVERDRYFIADRPLSTYAAEAQAAGRIAA
ncbi:DUF2958 domain-containing protein [Methylobacterium sp. sgz302541]|uniref:DUF2958 domain-containing protein n=1 Tax=unclassified Methylobacterium TaxID=2615210 RepID=UPI003D328ABE